MECRVFGDNNAAEFHKLRRGIWQNLPRKNGGPVYKWRLLKNGACLLIMLLVLCLTGRTDLAHVPNRFHGRAERAAELVTPTGDIRAALLLDRRSFVVGEKVVVEAVVCNQTDVAVHCAAVLQQVRISSTV